jgi:hypothetical protein
MPEFLHLSTHHSAMHPEVLLALSSCYDVAEADVGMQVMVHVESHEMADVEPSEYEDAKYPDDGVWAAESHNGRHSSTPMEYMTKHKMV